MHDYPAGILVCTRKHVSWLHGSLWHSFKLKMYRRRDHLLFLQLGQSGDHRNLSTHTQPDTFVHSFMMVITNWKSQMTLWTSWMLAGSNHMARCMPQSVVHRLPRQHSETTSISNHPSCQNTTCYLGNTALRLTIHILFLQIVLIL